MTTARSFSHEVSLAVGGAIGRETRAKHNNATGGTLSWDGESSLYCMAPMINVCQDVRWGRCQVAIMGRKIMFLQVTLLYVYNP